MCIYIYIYTSTCIYIYIYISMYVHIRAAYIRLKNCRVEGVYYQQACCQPTMCYSHHSHVATRWWIGLETWQEREKQTHNTPYGGSCLLHFKNCVFCHVHSFLAVWASINLCIVFVCFLGFWIVVFSFLGFHNSFFRLLWLLGLSCLASRALFFLWASCPRYVDAPKSGPPTRAQVRHPESCWPCARSSWLAWGVY